jgi:hypothetical protein
MQLDLLVAANIFFGLVTAGMNLLTIRLLNRRFAWRWVKIAYVVVGLGWASLYIGLTTGLIPRPDLAAFSARVVRPMVTITLALLAASSIISLRRHYAEKNIAEPEIDWLKEIKKFFIRLRTRG